ncbi:Prefoldin subunit-domain-containing protein [Paraphoma chrysanthemicola]|uniref:Prefoldin subunit-domain-containing protein n=1 Tax=Paraphoma chrysanthemicola TaxID=798071 RepID=A0A8K0QVY3_9PLEO|nr:Prefoldin subunit-domain-containing protein [Paraphoma chrysanthemicola]
MAASTQSALDGIERRRAQLQESVEKLRKALTHWTTWEAEYDTLKDELLAAGDPSAAQVRALAQRQDSQLLSADEVEELLGRHLQTKRNANQVVDMISRRIDYVRQNSATIEKQLDAAEKQLAGVDVLLEPGMDNEEGLPMMDIEEELDEAGNEVASTLNQTGKAAAEIAEVLRKAGLQEADLEKQQRMAKDQGNSPADGYNADIDSINFTRGTKVIELDHEDNELATYPIIPQGESEEDAELRRQMLQYGLSEVGSIVAELDLDHPTVDYSGDEDDFDNGDDSGDDLEDEYGRSLRPAITEDYRKQMLELEKKLNARMMENVGPQDSTASLADHVGDIRTLRVRKDEQFDRTQNTETTARPEPISKSGSKPKKGVRFADDLDVSSPSQPSHLSTANDRAPRRVATTMAETIVERATAQVDAPGTASKPARASRFLRDRAVQQPRAHVLPNVPVPEAPRVPTGPKGRTLASTVVEHDVQGVQPNPPDEFDPIAVNRELHTEYNKARNRFLQQQDGFKATEDDDESPIVEEKDGKTKKVSRFMSARLKANGM